MPVISPRNGIRSRRDHWDQKNTKKGAETKCMWHGEEDDVWRDGRMTAGERQSGNVNI